MGVPQLITPYDPFDTTSSGGSALELGSVNVRAFISGGLGTTASPWTGWETAFAAGSRKGYYFSTGVFDTPLLNLRGLSHLRLWGDGDGSVIRGTGNGVPVVTLGADLPTTFQITMEDLRICSTGTCTNGIEFESTHHSKFRNLKIIDVTNAGIFGDFGVLNTYDNVRITGVDGDQVVAPNYGFVFDCLNPANISSTKATLLNCHVSHTQVIGIDLRVMSGALLLNTVSEANDGKGIVFSANSPQNTFIGAHGENNVSAGQVEVASWGNTIIGLYNAEVLTVSGNRNTLIGCTTNTLTLSGNYNDAKNVLYALNGSGGFTDSGVENITDGIAPSVNQIPLLGRRNRAWVSRTKNGNNGGSNDPGYTEILHNRYDIVSTTAINLSDTVFATGKPWRVLFIGYWINVSTGPGLAMQPFVREVTSANPSFAVGSLTVTISQHASGVMQASASAPYCGFAGTVHIIVGNYATGLSNTSLVLQGDVSAGGIGRGLTASWFQATTVAASQLDVVLTNNSYPRGWVATRAGSVTSIAINLSTARSTGVLTINVQKSTDTGTTWTTITGCNLSITTNVAKSVVTFTRGTHAFAANDMLRAVISTDGSWAPTANNIDVAVEAEVSG